MISIIIPVYNEEKSIKDLIEGIQTAMRSHRDGKNYEIIIVDDGSQDKSVEIIKGYNVRLIAHGKRRGVGAARTTGVNAAFGEKIVFIDADMTYRPADVPRIIDALSEYDMVIGARKREAGTYRLIRSGIKNLFKMLAGLLTGTRIPDLNSGLRGMDRKKAIAFQYMLPQGHSWVSTITLCYLASGYSVGFIPIEYDKRRGKSSFHICRDTYTFFLTIVKTVVYFYPLRVIMPVSLSFVGAAFVFLIRDIIQRDLADTTVLLFVTAVMTFVFALIAEQLACLRREMNQRLSPSDR